MPEEYIVNTDLVEKIGKPLLNMLVYLYGTYNTDGYILFELRKEQLKQKIIIYNSKHEVLEDTTFSDINPATINIVIKYDNGRLIITQKS